MKKIEEINAIVKMDIAAVKVAIDALAEASASSKKARTSAYADVLTINGIITGAVMHLITLSNESVIVNGQKSIPPRKAEIDALVDMIAGKLPDNTEKTYASIAKKRSNITARIDCGLKVYEYILPTAPAEKQKAEIFGAISAKAHEQRGGKKAPPKGAETPKTADDFVRRVMELVASARASGFDITDAVIRGLTAPIETADEAVAS